MRNRALAVVFMGLVLLVGPTQGQDYNVPFRPQAAAGGGSGTDFTVDANMLGCWVMAETAEGETEAEEDHCLAGNDNPVIWQDATAWASRTSPAGSNGMLASDHDGTNGYYNMAHDVQFRADDFTVGCWIVTDNKDQLVQYFGKSATDWEMSHLNGGAFSHLVGNGIENAGTSPVNGTWYHEVMRFVKSGSTEIEIFTDGLPDCDGACNTDAGPLGDNKSLGIGANEAGGQDLDGGLMECWYADRAMTDTEICEITLCGLDGTADGAARDSAFGAAGCQCSDIDTCC